MLHIHQVFVEECVLEAVYGELRVILQGELVLMPTLLGTQQMMFNNGKRSVSMRYIHRTLGPDSLSFQVAKLNREQTSPYF